MWFILAALHVFINFKVFLNFSLKITFPCVSRLLLLLILAACLFWYRTSRYYFHLVAILSLSSTMFPSMSFIMLFSFVFPRKNFLIILNAWSIPLFLRNCSTFWHFPSNHFSLTNFASLLILFFNSLYLRIP